MVKTNSNYAVKVAKTSNRSLSIYLMNQFAQTSYMSLIENLLFNWTYFFYIWKMCEVAKFLFQ